MWRKALAPVLALAVLALPVAVRPQIPVTDVAHIVDDALHWTQNLSQWAAALARYRQIYDQAVTTYNHMQQIAKQLENPSVYTVLSLFAVTGSASMTRVDGVADFRRMLEGSSPWSTQLGSLYHSIYGAPLDPSHLAPGPNEDWATAATRINRYIQSADSAALEALTAASRVNQSLSDLHQQGTYENLANKIKDSNITPEQTAQAGALASLYTAQSVDKLTQVMTATATLQAQDVAQKEALNRQVMNEAQGQVQSFTDVTTSLRGDKAVVDGWQIH